MINVLPDSNNRQKFLILYDVTKEQWEQATKARKADLIAKGRVYCGDVETLASLDVGGRNEPAKRNRR